jgi:hypothetical protein
MKYGSYYSNSRTANNANNVGDSVIDLALNHVYNVMGVPESEIVRINPINMPEYDGEHIVLPVIRSFTHCYKINEAFSDNITPIFICFTLFGTLNNDDVDYLKRNEPIGCRDEYTMTQLRQHGIKAYLNGCITVCMPLIAPTDSQEKKRNKVFLVDIEPELEPYIPDGIKKEAIRLSHVLPGNLSYDPMQEAKRIIEIYKHEARLVITSRLHAASPCIAMGIPVILAKNEFSSRYTWIDKFIPFYDKFQYSHINWNPRPVELETHKEKVLRLVTSRIKTRHEEALLCHEVSNFYEQRDKREFTTALSKTIPLITNKRNKTEAFSYSIWGISVFAESAYQYMTSNYPNAKLAHVYDKYRKMKFHGLMSESIDLIKDHTGDFLIACPLSETISVQMQEHLQLIEKVPSDYILGFPVQ